MPRLDLTPFGFTPTESLVYEVLLTGGPGTGYSIARSAGLARANAYSALEGLVSKGAARADAGADAALGVAMYLQERAAEIALITPNGEKTHHITYGGPPRSLARWSVNLALDWLRRRATDLGGE